MKQSANVRSCVDEKRRWDAVSLGSQVCFLITRTGEKSTLWHTLKVETSSWQPLELVSMFEISVIDLWVSLMFAGGARTFSGCISMTPYYSRVQGGLKSGL